ncbi:MAG TPA: hypothetical protein VE913_23675, partial [Longimicrobium sp.]|nr:hypothetical protein [Longimicrobium sp.]
MPLHVEGTFHVPGDKSITHRALMFAAMGQGESRLAGLLPGEDCRSTAAVLRAPAHHDLPAVVREVGDFAAKRAKHGGGAP